MSLAGEEKVVLSWSGGKDSALALWAMREELGIEPVALLTTITEDYGRISMHAVRRELLHAQAAAVGVPLVEVGIPALCSNEIYEERMAAALAAPPLAEVEEFAFADLFLADIRAYREERLASIGRRATFPLWDRDTTALCRLDVDVVEPDARRADDAQRGQLRHQLLADRVTRHRQHRNDILLRRSDDVESRELRRRVAPREQQQLHSTRERKRFVRSCFGEEKNSSGSASSTMRPSSITSTELATW